MMEVVHIKLNQGLPWEKQRLTTVQRLFTNKLDLNFWKKLVTCHIWSTALYGAERWTLRQVGQKYTESFKTWC